MFIRSSTFLALFSLLPALAHALPSLPPVTRGRKGPAPDSRKVIVKGYGGVVFPGNGGGAPTEAEYDLVDGGSGEVNMAGRTLRPFFSRMVPDPSGETHNVGFNGDTAKSMVWLAFNPTCYFNGKLTGDGDITFNFAPTTDFLFPCGDSHRGLEIVCDWNGKPADCLNKPFQ